MATEANVPSWQMKVVDWVVRALPFSYGMIWGCFFAVFFGAVEPSGEALKGFAAFAATLTGAGLGIWGSKTVSERNAERERRRSAYADYLTVQSCIRAILELQDALLAVEKKEGKTIDEQFDMLAPDERGRLMTTMIAMTGQYENVPTFKDCIETDTDHAKAHRIREVFLFLERMFRQFKNADDRSSLKTQTKVLLHHTSGDGLDRMRDALLRNGSYFREKLGIER